MKYRNTNVSVIKMGKAASKRLQELLVEKEGDEKPITTIVEYLGSLMLYTDYTKKQMKHCTRVLVGAAISKRYHDLSRVFAHYFMLDEIARRIREGGDFDHSEYVKVMKKLNFI